MTTPRKVAFADIARRITGISTPIFGVVSWNPPESKRNVARGIIRFVEDRRALYADFHMEYGPWVERSVLRGTFGLHLARLCATFGVDAEPELAFKFPIADAEEAEL